MYSYRRKAQYHETDRMGVIHHSNYIRWMEEARVAFMADAGFPYQDMEALGIVSPVVSLSVEYKKPYVFGDEAEIRLFVEKYSGVVLAFRYEFYAGDGAELRTAAASRHCFLQNGRPVSLKRALPELDDRLRSMTGRNERSGSDDPAE